MDFAETLKKLMALQTTDSGLDELERLQKGFAKEMTSLDANVTNLKTQVQNEKKALEDLLKGRKTLEIEAGSLDTKIKKYQSQESEVKSNEQFAALKLEIEKSREEKAKTEEKVLECLFKEDAQKLRIQDVSQQLAQAEKKAADDKKAIEVKVADCRKAAAEKQEERKKQLAELPAEAAEGYESLRNHGKKIAVAQVREDMTCSGCNMNIPPQILNEIKKNMALQRCNCGRYLHVKE